MRVALVSNRISRQIGGLPISFNQDLLVASMALVVSIVAVCLGRRSAMLRMIIS
jgi:hypothetical protein